jgi:hypothetical protein
VPLITESQSGRLMADKTGNVLLSFPARSLTDGERQIVRTWAAAADGWSALVSEGRGDDPVLRRRIVIWRGQASQYAYIVHAPEGLDVWVAVAAAEGEPVGRFPTLRAALNFVQSTAFDPEAAASPSDADGPSGLGDERGPAELAITRAAAVQSPG